MAAVPQQPVYYGQQPPPVYYQQQPAPVAVAPTAYYAAAPQAAPPVVSVFSFLRLVSTQQYLRGAVKGLPGEGVLPCAKDDVIYCLHTPTPG